ncbi:MAG TPA: tyrosine--tRNA ligase [Candidatus Limnocylindrales bacterium]|jgi:tyrosyl-tRNA synthetase
MTEVTASTHAELVGFLDELEWRGILHATTPGIRERLATGRSIAAYIGFDPTADSLHVGHLIPIFGLLRFQRHGGTPVALVGGGTGMIGDPSGRSTERNLLDLDTLTHNVAAIRAQLERFLDFSPGPNPARIANNLDWLGKLSLIEYLRDTGKHFTIPYMLAKDSVQQRLERGLSFTEFSYMTLQALDFATLYREQGVELQMGGADQWGNITAGLELIRRTAGADHDESPAHGIAYKLLLSPSGAKFGKSEGGDSVWLDPARTTPYAFYQYWLNTDDRDVGMYLRWFTLFEREEIEGLDGAVVSRPESREAQRRLAFDVTARVHGDEAAHEAERQGRTAFTQDLSALSADDLAAMREQVPHFVLTGDALANALDAAIGSNAFPSRGEARRHMANGGFYVNNVRITDPTAALPEPLHGRFWVVRTGKKHVRLVERAG